MDSHRRGMQCKERFVLRMWNLQYIYYLITLFSERKIQEDKLKIFKHYSCVIPSSTLALW